MYNRKEGRVVAACSSSMQLAHLGAPAKTYTCAVKTAGRSGCWLRAIRAIERAKAKKGIPRAGGDQSSARRQSCFDPTPGSGTRQVGLGGYGRHGRTADALCTSRQRTFGFARWFFWRSVHIYIIVNNCSIASPRRFSATCSESTYLARWSDECTHKGTSYITLPQN